MGMSNLSMTAQLWSINGLAAELGKDRRTVASALRTVPPDGKLQGHPAWFLATALATLRPEHAAAPDRQRRSAIIEVLLDRLEGWQEAHDPTNAETRRREAMGGPITVPVMAQLIGAAPQDVLTWLRAGMPYQCEGDWRTGRGFELVPAWAIEWVLTVIAQLRLNDDWDAARRLGLYDHAFGL